MAKTPQAVEIMGKMKFIRKVAAIGAMCLAFAGVAGQVVQAQRPALLFSDDCVRQGNTGREQQNVSIGKELFTSIFYMFELSQVTCRIRLPNSTTRFKTLRLAFGVADNREGNKPVEVKVYLDGNLAESRTLSIGEKSLILVDISRTSSVAIEVPGNADGYGTEVSIVQAILEPISSSSSPGRRR